MWQFVYSNAAPQDDFVNPPVPAQPEQGNLGTLMQAIDRGAPIRVGMLRSGTIRNSVFTVENVRYWKTEDVLRQRAGQRSCGTGRTGGKCRACCNAFGEPAVVMDRQFHPSHSAGTTHPHGIGCMADLKRQPRLAAPDPH